MLDEKTNEVVATEVKTEMATVDATTVVKSEKKAGDTFNKKLDNDFGKKNDSLVLKGATPEDSKQPETIDIEDVIMGVIPAMSRIGIVGFAQSDIAKRFSGVKKSLREWRTIIK